MVLLSHGRYVLLGVVTALALGAGGALASPPGRVAAQAQPTMVLSPSSGPCDAAAEARGSGFAPLRPSETLWLYLVRPGTADVSMGTLNSADVGPDGTFVAWVGFFELRCQAAALDAQAQQPTGRLLIAASSGETAVEPGERISDITAVAQYVYTTTTRQPQPTMVISPSQGPCDGMVEVQGGQFQPGQAIRLDLAAPGSDAMLGTLASAVADDAGEFAVGFELGDLGCRAADLNTVVGDPARPQLGIVAWPAAYPTPVPQGIPPALAHVSYTYTTTAVGGTPPPRFLPATGGGENPSSAPPLAVFFAGALMVLGLLLVAAALRGRRERS